MAGDAVLLQDATFVAVAARASMINPIGKGSVAFLPCSNPLPGLTASNRCKIKSMRASRFSQRDSVRVFRRGCSAPCHFLGQPCWQSNRDMDCFNFDIRRSFRNKKFECYASDVGKDEELDPEDDKTEIEGTLNIDEEIPVTSDSFLKQVSSRAYDMRRKLEQNLDSSSYDVLDSNPWRDDSKSLYVLAQEDEQLLTMRTRRARSEVERELGLLFPKRGSRRGPNGSPRNKSSEQMAPGKPNQDSHFRMQVEDVREGVLVFEDEEEAAQYCNLLDGQGQGCMGVAELEASDVFAMCKKTNTLAVFFPRGTTPPLPNRLQHDLKARKRSLED